MLINRSSSSHGENNERIEDIEALPDHAEGALALVGAWHEVPDEEMDELIRGIYLARERDLGRPVDLTS